MNRLGNNLLQVINACKAAHENGAHEVLIPKHPLFKSRRIPIHNNNSTETSLHFSKAIVDLYLKDFLLIPPAPQNKKDLIIHVRSGDVFGKNVKHARRYTQPPYSYYTKCIEMSKKNQILIVTEKDRRNPVISKLKKDFSNNIRIQSSNLQEDAATILSAEELVLPKSSFSRTLSLFSPFLKKIYSPFWQYSINSIESESFYFPDYKLGPWEKSAKQLDNMMNYEQDKIKLFKRSKMFNLRKI